ncbi:TonB-dependent receptor [Phocaeicola sp.]
MKRRTIILGIAVCLVFAKAAAQQSIRVTSDSISIFKLVEEIEKQTDFRVYILANNSFKVKVNRTDLPLIELLKETLSPFSHRVSVMGKQLFILPGKELFTELPAHLSGKQEGTEQYNVDWGRKKAGSENLIYEVGNPLQNQVMEKATLHGQVFDFKSGEPLMGINIIVRKPWVAAVTDKDGKYSLELPRGRTELEISGMNVKQTRRQLVIHGDGAIDIELEEDVHILSGVTITAGRVENVKSTQLGVERLRPNLLKNIPMALGEVDILKAVQALPGVKTVGEASNGFNVRGGATDQNLILLNDGTIYNPNHLFGFFSAFNSDMIKEAEIYKSSIPAKFGGRISSVLDINGREANKEKFCGSAGIGLVTSKLNLEIPLVKEQTSLLLSGRTTYSDWILKSLPEKSGYKDGTAGFFDIGGVLSHRFNERNSLSLYGYYSHDRFAFNNNEKYAYNNLNASIKLHSIFNDHLVGIFTVGHDHYDYTNEEAVNENTAGRLSFGINHLFVKADFDWKPTHQQTLSFGFKSLLYNINSGKYEPIGESSLVQRDALQKDKALENALYIGDQWEITPQLSVNAGIRYSIFNALGPRTYYNYPSNSLPEWGEVADTVTVGSDKMLKTYHGAEFRLSARYAFTERFSVKTGFNSMRQYIHKLSNTVIMSPTDSWKLSDANIKPQRGWQLAAGLYMDSPEKDWEYSLEGYYKKMSDYLDYRNAAQLLMNHHIETDVVPTEGYAYGIEFQIKKPFGKLNGWVSYTYSRTFLRQADKRITNPVNGGDWYPTEYDKPHDFKFVGNYRFTKRYSLSVNMDYSTGRPTTIPAGQYYDHKLHSLRVFYTDRNSYRIPDYFRTDLSFNIEPSHKLTLLTHSSISIGVYNVTGRRNIYSIYYVSEEGKIKGYQMSIFGVPIPFVTYNIKF